MTKNPDLRVRKTYLCLMNALLALLKEKRFEEITVNELCDKAMVSRGTFYRHFTDKYEFFSFVLENMLNHYLDEAETRADVTDPCSYYMAFFEALLGFMEENGEALRSLTRNNMTSAMMLATSEILSQKLQSRFEKDENEGRALAMNEACAARFLTGAMAQSAKFLVSHPEDDQKDEILRNMKILIKKIYE